MDDHLAVSPSCYLILLSSSVYPHCVEISVLIALLFPCFLDSLFSLKLRGENAGVEAARWCLAESKKDG